MSNVLNIRRIKAGEGDFDQQLKQMLAWESVSDTAVNQRVEEILAQVREQGDAAVVDLTNRFDATTAVNMADLELSQERLQQALKTVTDEQREALATAAKRVRDYHERQVASSWQYQESDGTLLGQQVTPMDRVGIYVPGGKAAYPSSVLMNAIPAQVAGVERIIMCSPSPDGETSPHFFHIQGEDARANPDHAEDGDQDIGNEVNGAKPH